MVLDLSLGFEAQIWEQIFTVNSNFCSTWADRVDLANSAILTRMGLWLVIGRAVSNMATYIFGICAKALGHVWVVRVYCGFCGPNNYGPCLASRAGPDWPRMIRSQNPKHELQTHIMVKQARLDEGPACSDGVAPKFELIMNFWILETKFRSGKTWVHMHRQRGEMVKESLQIQVI